MLASRRVEIAVLEERTTLDDELVTDDACGEPAACNGEGVGRSGV